MHGAEGTKKTVRPFFRSNSGKWLFHFVLFAAFQVLFLLTDGARVWDIFGLSKFGEKLVAFLHPFFDQFQIYSSERLNYVTAVWGVVILVHGIASLVEWLKIKLNNLKK